jgi:hypothetical protein
MIVTEKKNLDILYDIINRSENRVVIITPWITNRKIVSVLKRNNQKQIDIIIRWPTENDNPDFYDINLIRELTELENVELYYTNNENPLHAKVYYGEKYKALITSANLTEKGFPQQNGNIELGVIIKNSNQLNNLESWIDKIFECNNIINNENIQKLKKWNEAYIEWKEKIEEYPPKIENPIHETNSQIIQALDFAKDNNLIIDFEHIQNNYGRKAFYLDLNNRRKNFPVRIIESISNKNSTKKYKIDYHFDIPKHDIISWINRKKNSVKGIILIPLRYIDNKKVFNREDGNLISYIPFTAIFSKKKFKLTKKYLSKKEKLPTLFLSKTINDMWVLRFSRNAKQEIVIGDCIGSTTSLKKQNIYYDDNKLRI